MKISQTTLLFGLAVILTSCAFRDHDIKISMSESDDYFRFEAFYPKSKTGAVQRFINASLPRHEVFKSEDDVLDIATTLQDGTNFQLKSSRGELKIKLDKKRNSRESYRRIRAMGEGVKEVLK